MLIPFVESTTGAIHHKPYHPLERTFGMNPSAEPPTCQDPSLRHLLGILRHPRETEMFAIVLENAHPFRYKFAVSLDLRHGRP